MRKLLLLLLTCPILSFGQFFNFSTNNGLIGDNVQCFKEDGSGNLWVGTYSGISYYNGIDFTNYTTNDGLISNSVKTIEISNANKIWIGTSSGISVYNGFSFANYTTNEGLIGNNVCDIQKDSIGNIWIATTSGISVYNGFTFVNYTTAHGLPTNSIRQISMDNGGTIWIGTSEGLCRFDNPGFTTWTTVDGLPVNLISILSAKDNIYMNAGGARICVFDGTTFTIYDDNNGLPSSGLLKGISIDSDTNIWIAYTDKVIKFDLLSAEYYSSLNTNLITSGMTNIYSADNNVYVPTSYNGFFITDNNVSLNDYDTLMINNINALVNCNGLLFANMYNYWESLFEVPANSGKMSNYASTIWIGGMDDNNIFHLAAGKFQGSEDWASGPIVNNYNSFEYDSAFNRVWKINKSIVDYHILHWNDTGYIVPLSIQEWPNIADYLDSNLNSIYDPENGDYPLIMGDQAILNIFNDDKISHTTGRNKMKIEVHSIVYGYDVPTDSGLYNTVFVQYKIKNKSTNNYSNVYMGVFDDICIGKYWDDFFGADTSTNSYYIYNGDNYDDDYGTHISAQGVCFLSSKMSSAAYHDWNSYPQTSTAYFNILTGYWPDGTPYTYGGTGYGGTTPVNYVFTGNPQSPVEWNEGSAGNTPGNRQGIGVVGPFTLDVGQEICIDVAYVNAIAYDGDNLLSVKYLISRMGYIQWWKSQNPGLSCDTIITISGNSLFVYAQDTVCCANTGDITLNSIHTGGVYPFTYQWADSLGIVFSTDANPAIPFPTSTPINYYITITDAQANTAIDTLTVVVNTLPVINLGTYSNLCSGDTVSIDISGYAEYQWSNGNSTSIVHLTLPGDYYVTVTDYYGCTATDNTSLVFSPNNLDLNDITPSCVGGSITIDAGSGFSSYLWNTTETTQTIVINTPFTGQATYSVTVTAANGCTFTDSTIVDITAPCTYLGNDTTISSNETVPLYPGNYIDYLWSSSATSPQYLFDGSVGIGSYTIWVQTTDYYGCISGDTIIIIVDSLVSIINDVNATNVQIFPNPTTGKIVIVAVGIENIKVLNIQGKQIFDGIENEIDLKEHNKGIYIIKVTTNKGVAVDKVVLE
ncbi:MAG: two-component regulator propeller domain-containing protein [Bacteroidota bacterium]